MIDISRLILWLFLFVLILVVAFLFFSGYWRHKLGFDGIYDRQVAIGKTKIWVQVADNMAKRYQGLSYRDKMCGDCGMLFIFKKAGRSGFVMRGMRFGLDFVWINRGKVVDVTTGVEPSSRQVYIGRGKYDWVLELNSGFVKKHGIKVGDEVVIRPDKKF